MASLHSRPHRAPAPPKGTAGAALPPPVHINVRLKDGTEMVLQTLRPADRDRLLQGYAHLSAHSRRMRFLHPMGPMPEALVDRLLAVDARDHVAWFAETADGRTADSRTLGGIARYIRPDHGATTAEMAVTVLDDAQGHGLGSVLLGTIMRSANAHGVDEFTGLVLAENQPMRHLIADLGGRFDFSGSDALTFTMPVPSRAADLPDTPTGRVVALLYRALPAWPPEDGTRIEIPQV